MGTSSSCRPPSGDVAVAEEQRGDRSGLERLSPKPHWVHVLTQEVKSSGQGEMVEGISQAYSGGAVRASIYYFSADLLGWQSHTFGEKVLGAC